MVSHVSEIARALNLTGAQQSAIGFFWGGAVASIASPITTCAAGVGATQIRIPPPGTENDDTNPARVVARNLFDLGAGTDNLLRHAQGMRVLVRFTVENLTNKMALYNFLSTFSGTHFVQPRTYQVQVGLAF